MFLQSQNNDDDDWGDSEWPDWIVAGPQLGIRFGNMYGGFWTYVVIPQSK